VAFAAGMWLAGRSSEMHALRQDLQATRSILVISLLQQSSPASRLQGIAYSAGVDSPDPQVVELLFETLDHDTSVDVRLAAVDALAAVRGDASVGRRLTASLATQSSPLVQIGIVDALVHRRESSARATLQQMSESSRVNREVREHAKWAMGQLTL